MTTLWVGASTRRRVLLAADIAVRLAIVFWLAEAWVLQNDPRFADKAIAERNTVIVGTLSLLIPAIWRLRRLPWSRFPLGLDILYLSIFAFDMAGNSFDLYDSYTYFDLIPHFHGPGAVSLIAAVYWARTRHPGAPDAAARHWLFETTLVAAGIATILHAVLEVQEYYTDVIAGTINVGGIADTLNDQSVGMIGAMVYPLLAVRWFLPGRVRIGWRSAVTLVGIALFATAMMIDPGPRVADAIANQFATKLPEHALSGAQRDQLLGAAHARAAAPPVAVEGELHHAHDSATFDELLAALTGDFQSIEGDVGLVGDVPVVRHDPRDAVEVTFAEWLEVVAAARFDVVKIDIKRDRVAPLIADLDRAVREFGLSERQLQLNSDVLEEPGAYKELSRQEHVYFRIALKLEPEDLVEIAERFPDAAVSIGFVGGPVPAGVGFGPDDIEHVLAVAADLRAAGTTRISIAARWDLLNDDFVAAMTRARVVVDVWNSLTIASPDDPAAESIRLRERYGDARGVIDLRREDD